MSADHPTSAESPRVRLHDVSITGDTADGEAVLAAVARAVARAMEGEGSTASRSGPVVEEVAAGVSDLVSRQVVLPDIRD